MKKRLISMFLIACMMLSLMPATFADDAAPITEQEQNVQQNNIQSEENVEDGNTGTEADTKSGSNGIMLLDLEGPEPEAETSEVIEFENGQYVSSELYNKLKTIANDGNSRYGYFKTSSTALSTTEVSNNSTVKSIADGEYGISARGRILFTDTGARFTAKSFYNVGFNIVGLPEGTTAPEVKFNGETVTDTAKLYKDSNVTVEAGAVEGFIYKVEPVNADGTIDMNTVVASADKKVKITYSDDFATYSVTANEGGTVSVVYDGTEHAAHEGWLPTGSSLEVKAAADTANAYYVKSVTIGGESIDKIESAVKNANYEIVVEFAQITSDFTSASVNIEKIKSEAWSDIQESIKAEIVASVSEEFAEGAVVSDLQYMWGNAPLLGAQWRSIGQSKGLLDSYAHIFGYNNEAGIVEEGNTEEIRATVTNPNFPGIKLSINGIAVVKDMRTKTRIDQGTVIFVTYNDNENTIRDAITKRVIVVDDEPTSVTYRGSVEHTADEIIIPEIPDPKYFEVQDVTVKYVGNENYAACTGTVRVYVRHGTGTISVKTEVIPYDGNQHKPVITANPENLPYVYVIAGAEVEGEAGTFFSLCMDIDSVFSFIDKQIDNSDASSIEKGAQKLIVAGVKVGVSAFQGTDISASDLINILDGLNQIPGFDFEQILTIIDLLPVDDISFGFNKYPVDIGAYTVTPVCIDFNYLPLVVPGVITIVPAGPILSDAKLQWKKSIPQNAPFNIDNVKEFDFDAKLLIKDTEVSGAKINYSFTGTTYDGKVYNSDKAPTVPGNYRETASITLIGSNYFALPITRSFIIAKPIYMESYKSVVFNGEAYVPTVYDYNGTPVTEGVEITAVDANGNVVEPINVGTYKITASKVIDGNTYTATQTLVITKRSVRIIINDGEKKFGEVDPEFTFDVVSEKQFVGDDAQLIALFRGEGEEVGQYMIKLVAPLDDKIAKNYNVIIVNNGVFTIKAADAVLEWNEEIPEAIAINNIGTYDFGGKLFLGEDEQDAELVKVQFIGTDYSGNNYSSEEVPSRPGSYTETISVDSKNYNVESKSRTFIIEYPINIAEVMTTTYGEAIEFPKAVDEKGDILSDDVVRYELAPVDGNVIDVPEDGILDAGEYKYTAFLDGTEYFAVMNLKVQKRNVTISVDDNSKIYSMDDPELTMTVGGLGFVGDDAQLITLTRDEGENVGKYTIHPSWNNEELSNYNVTFEKIQGEFEITPFSIADMEYNEMFKAVYGSALIETGEEQLQQINSVTIVNAVTGKTLDVTYTLEGNNGTTFGGYVMTVYGSGNFCGARQIPWGIAPSEKSGSAADGNKIAFGEGSFKLEIVGDLIEMTKVTTPLKNMTGKLTENGVITAEMLAELSSTADANYNVVITIKDIEQVITDKSKTAIVKAAGSKTVGMYFDISIKAIYTCGADQTEKQLSTELGDIEFKLKVPSELLNSKVDFTRYYTVIRLHDGATALIDAPFTAADGNITFTNGLFSEFGLAYKDVDNRVPSTGDDNNALVWAAAMALAMAGILGAAYTVIVKRKEEV